VEFWHNKTVWKMVYDHFKNPHELYAATDHGVDKFSPDLWRPTIPGTWFNSKENNQRWMSDTCTGACYHHYCKDEDPDQRLGDFRGSPSTQRAISGGRTLGGRQDPIPRR